MLTLTTPRNTWIPLANLQDLHMVSHYNLALMQAR